MVSKELFESIYKIARGRVACFAGIPVDERDDVIQDCMLAVVQYINRYREDLDTSAFAYVTQVLSNALKLHMGAENDSKWCRQPWNDISDQCIALMYGVEEANDDYET
jgi:DNA-directed RNA polymerase specialized sigma24 family protein